MFAFQLLFTLIFYSSFCPSLALLLLFLAPFEEYSFRSSFCSPLSVLLLISFGRSRLLLNQRRLSEPFASPQQPLSDRSATAQQPLKLRKWFAQCKLCIVCRSPADPKLRRLIAKCSPCVCLESQTFKSFTHFKRPTLLVRLSLLHKVGRFRAPFVPR